MEKNDKLIRFEEQQIRRIWDNGVWWYSIIDVIGILIGNDRPSKYWNDLKRKIVVESGTNELSDNIGKFKFMAADGKLRSTECATRQTLMRILMSVPSPKAEPFRLWLAQVGEQHIQEIENPELGIERIRNLYKSKGYADEWIDERIKGIETRKYLTDEWKERGVADGVEYAILTAEIAKATFGLTPSEHSDLKNLKRHNLRDHMTELELIFTRLGELSTRNNAVEEDAQGFNENRKSAQKGGLAAGNARKSYEKTAGVKVVSPENFINLITGDSNKKLPKD